MLGEIGSRSPETPKIEFAMASLLEGAGFEPSVPGRRKGCLRFGEGEARKGHGDDKGRSQDGEYLKRDRGFEFGPLQRRVCKLSVPYG